MKLAMTDAAAMRSGRPHTGAWIEATAVAARAIGMVRPRAGQAAGRSAAGFPISCPRGASGRTGPVPAAARIAESRRRAQARCSVSSSFINLSAFRCYLRSDAFN